MEREKIPGITRALGYGAWLTFTSPRVWLRVWFASVATAAIAATALYANLATVLNHSRESLRLVDGFNAASLLEAVRHSQVSTASISAAAEFAIVLFVVVFLFLEGGILSNYWGRANGTGRSSVPQFYADAAKYFGPMLRLALWSLIPLALAVGLRGIAMRVASAVGDSAADERTEIHATFAAFAVGQLLFLAVRLWHDMAQVAMIAEDERRAWRGFKAGFKITFRNFWRLYVLELVTAVSGAAVLACGVTVWHWLPAPSVGRALFVAQCTLGVFIGTRLWQRASQVAWYQRYAEWNTAPVVPLSRPMVIDASAPVIAAGEGTVTP